MTNSIRNSYSRCIISKTYIKSSEHKSSEHMYTSFCDGRWGSQTVASHNIYIHKSALKKITHSR